MNCFRLIRNVLDDLYEQIPLDSDEEKDKAICCKLNYLHDIYKGLIRGVIVDYADPATCFAYMYCYVVAHADIIYQIISNTPSLRNIFSNDELTISCFGGGPGSDLLGVLKFMSLSNRLGALKCNIYDKEKTWFASLKGIVNNLELPFSVNVTLQLCDITTKISWERVPKLFDTNLFTMSFLLSEVNMMQKIIQSSLMALFEHAKPGSFFIFVDNSSGMAHESLDSIIEDYNEWRDWGCMNLIERPDDKRVFTLDYNEEKRDMGPYYSKSKFGEPKLTSPVYYRIYRKA